jgi:ATP-binding cassette subfamily F protein uup
LQRVSALSGGWKKRLAFACAIAQQPDIVLLDEPTNHLDLEGISWLEGWLKQAPFAWMVISHDRYFLENVATSVIELHRVYKGGLLRVDGNYSAFLERKQEYMIAQEQYQSSLATRMRREKEWLQRGPKARTTKAKARIDEAGRLESELQSVKERTSQSGRQAQIDFTATGRRTKELMVAEHVEKEMGGKPLLGGLSFKLTPKKRIGILGANGSGKTTLLRMITGELEPDQGTIERAEQLQIVYFAQERYPLDLSVTLRKALAPDGDSVVFRGSSVHVVSWSRRFLFRDEQLDIKLHLLSGGEQARVRIARLMLEPADILLLDEPTNDLDIETLEILEENLLSFPGALVLVTHDRYLLDRVCDTVIGITDEGKAEWFADFRQWEQHQASLAKASKQRAKQQAQTTTTPDATPTKRVKMSYNEKKELQQMEETILEAETHLEECQEAVANPDIASDAALLQEWYEKLQQAEAEVERLYARWTELEQKKANS